MNDATTTQSEGIPFVGAYDQAKLFTSADSDALMQWRVMLNRVWAIGRIYQDDWDGEGAERPSRGAIIAASVFLEKQYSLNTAPPSRIVPTPLGAILVEWQDGDIYVEAEINDQWIIEWMRRDATGRYTHWEEVLPQETRDVNDDYLWSHVEKAA